MNSQGRLLNGRYGLLREQRADDAATTWEALDTALDRPVAVKLLNRWIAGDPHSLERFLDNVRAAAGLVDPAIIPVYDVGQDGETGVPFVVTPLVQGESLAHRLRGKTSLPNTTICAIGRVVAGALEYAHRHGIVHGDIRPEHILLGADGRARLTGFGLASARAGNPARTAPSAATARHTAPELAGGQPATPAADIYGLGAVLYQMATGRMPFVADGDADLSSAQAKLDLRPPRSLNRHLGPDLEAVIVRALAESPEHGFATAGELQRALGAPSSVEPVLTAPTLAGGPAAYASHTSGAPASPGRPSRPARAQLEHHRTVGILGLVGLSIAALAILAQVFGPPQFLDERGGLTIGIPIVAAIPTPTFPAPVAAGFAPTATPLPPGPSPTATLIPPPPTVLAAAAPELDPAETIRLHYRLIDERRYDEGYALMSARLRAQHSPDTYRNWFANKVSLRAVSVVLLSQQGDTAVVESEVDTADRVDDRTVERRARERFAMVLENEGWRIDLVVPL